MRAYRGFDIQSILCVAFGIGLMLPSAARAQFEGIDPKNWFPLELGNYWSYECCEDVIKDNWVVFSERDTVVDGRRWVFFKEVYGSGPYYGGVDVSLWDATVGAWYTMTDDQYVLRSWTRSLSNPDTIPPTRPHSALASTAAFDDTTFSYPFPPHPDDSVVVWIYQGDIGSEEDSTNLVLSVSNGYPPDAGGWGYGFYYKIGFAGPGYTTLLGARVNGLDWGDQGYIDRAIILGRDVEVPPGTILELEVFPNPAIGKPTLSLNVARAGVYLIEIFDTLGRAHASVREFLTPSSGGARPDIWSIDPPSGVYLISVTAADGTRVVRTVTLLR